METISKSDCHAVGYIQKTHGIKGEVVVQLQPEFSNSLTNEPTIMLECDQLLVPFFITPESLRIRSSETVSLKLDWIDDEIQAAALVRKKVFLRHKDIIMEEDNFSIHHLTGFQLYDRRLGRIGPIEQVNDYGGNLVFHVRYQNKEILLPFNEDFLIRLDPKALEIELDCPEGVFSLD